LQRAIAKADRSISILDSRDRRSLMPTADADRGSAMPTADADRGSRMLIADDDEGCVRSHGVRATLTLPLAREAGEGIC
jgi:hypothetical protein